MYKGLDTCPQRLKSKRTFYTAGIGAHAYLSTDGGRTMTDITENVARAEGIDLGGHTPVPYFIDEGALLAFDNGQIAINGR